MTSPDESEESEPQAIGGVADAVETFRLPHYGRLWTSNLVQFVCFQIQGLAMQWLVTSLTPLRSAVGLVGFVLLAIGSVIRPNQRRGNSVGAGHRKRTVKTLGDSGQLVTWIEVGDESPKRRAKSPH